MATPKNINWKVESITLDRNNPYQHPLITAELSTAVLPKTWSPNELAMDLQDHLNKKATPEIKNVIFNPPATIILWTDNTKTVVKCQDGDEYDPEKGLAMAIVKKMFGNTGKYCEIFKKWVKEEKNEEELPKIPSISYEEALEKIKKAAARSIHIDLGNVKTFSKALNDFAEKEAAKTLAEKLEKESGWTETRFKMPTEDGDYLVFDPFTGSSYVYEFCTGSISDTSYWKSNITYWMPVPSLPCTKKGE